MDIGDDWGRLARYVTGARVAAGFRSREDFAAVAGVTSRTLGKLERGQRVSPQTLAAVEPHCGWKPGSCQKILAGGEPDLVQPNPYTTLTPAERRAVDQFIALIQNGARREDPHERGA